MGGSGRQWEAMVKEVVGNRKTVEGSARHWEAMGGHRKQWIDSEKRVGGKEKAVGR